MLSNKDFEYYWSDDWVYRNISCKPLSLNGRFVKFLRVSGHAVPTMVTEKTFVPLPEGKSHSVCLGSAAASLRAALSARVFPPPPVGRSAAHIRHVGKMILKYHEIGVSIPSIDFDAHESGMRHELSLPNSAILQYEDVEGISWTDFDSVLRDWISLA